MPSKRISFHDFDARLWLSGGRDQIPPNGLRRAVGIAPEATRSLQSRWGSGFLASIGAISSFQFAGTRYAYDGTNLYTDQGTNTWIILTQNGGTITWNGTRLTFVVMPPQPGLPDYLFILGGGNAIKIAPALVGGMAVPVAQQVTQWGINAPANGMTAQLGLQELITIDQFDTTANNWKTSGTGENTNCTITNDTTDPFSGTADMKVAIAANVGSAVHTSRVYTTPLHVYSDGTISLQTDIISIYFKCPHPANIGYFKLIFNVGDNTNLLSAPFTLKDYYELTVQIVQTTNQSQAAGAQVTVTPADGQWVQVAAAKSQFLRHGTNLNFDWSDVNGIRLVIGDLGDVTATHCNFDQLQMFGGFPLGAGPAAIQNGSTYDYYVTFGNNTTGSDSNPNGMQVLADGDVNPPTAVVLPGVKVQQGSLNNIPVSTDAQVGNRKLWRTSAGGAEAFFLDIIPDNTTTAYIDIRGDLPGQPIIVTPWTKNVAYSSTVPDYVDSGTGYYFKCTTSGTSQTPGPPTWQIPSGPFLGFWSPITQYQVGNWVNFQGTGYLCIANAFGPTQSPTNAAFWTALSTTTDGTVVWTWAGLNEVPHLDLTHQLLLDNAAPLTSYGDAAGPFQDSMFWDRDSTPGRRGWVYSSPPGRPESVANQFAPTSDDDPTRKLVIFDYALWLITTKLAFQADGSNPDSLVFNPIMYATGIPLPPTGLSGIGGTSDPGYAIAAGQEGIYYQASDGIRLINRSGSYLPGFDALATVERNQFAENVQPFTAVSAAFCRNEIMFSDGSVTFGLSLVNGRYVWRMMGVGLSALYYERNDNQILAGLHGATVLFEDPGTVVDQTAALVEYGILLEVQTPSELLDEGQVAVIRRIFVDVNCKVEPAFPQQVLGILAITDNTVTSLGTITDAQRTTHEIAFQQPARQFSLRITACLTNRIEIFAGELDCAITGAEETGYAAYADKTIES